MSIPYFVFFNTSHNLINHFKVGEVNMIFVNIVFSFIGLAFAYLMRLLISVMF
jgi:hypothetical protein